MIDETKIAYEPSQTKRFEISRDPYSRERLKAASETIRELKSRYPFVVGAVLFGSLSKGKFLNEQSAGGSDIDMAVYLDADKAGESYKKIEEENDALFVISVEADSIFCGSGSGLDHRSEDERKLEILGLYIGGLAEDAFKRRVLGQSFPKYKPDMGIMIKAISFTGEYSMYEIFKKIFLSDLKADQSMPKKLEDVVKDLETDTQAYSPLTISDVALPWSLDIGGGLAKYRRSYLAQLQHLDPIERDLRWKTTIAAVKFYERQSVIPEGIQKQYPSSYDEALKYYGGDQITGDVNSDSL